MIGMVMGKKQVSNGVTINRCLKQVHERSRAEIKEERVIGLNQIPRCRTGGVEIGSGAKDCQSHRRQHMYYGACL